MTVDVKVWWCVFDKPWWCVFDTETRKQSRLALFKRIVLNGGWL